MRIPIVLALIPLLAACGSNQEMVSRDNASLVFESVTSTYKRPLLTVYDETWGMRHVDVPLGVKRCQGGVEALVPGDRVPASVERWLDRDTGGVEFVVDLAPLADRIC